MAVVAVMVVAPVALAVEAVTAAVPAALATAATVPGIRAASPAMAALKARKRIMMAGPYGIMASVVNILDATTIPTVGTAWPLQV